MANREHLAILQEGISTWNQWREEHPETQPDLSRADLSRQILGTTFEHINLSGANLKRAKLRETILQGADLKDAKLSKADLVYAQLVFAELQDAELVKAFLCGASLLGSKLNGANLYGANLETANFTKVEIEGANLSKCKVYGIAAWDLEGVPSEQFDLQISTDGQPRITLDNLEVAQFINLILNKEKIRYAIDTITTKVILILGRFKPDRKKVLDAIRINLRERNCLPVLFDFEKPASRNLTETVSTLAHMSRFIIADITDPRSVPQELQRVVPNLPSVPVQPILHEAEAEYGMFGDFRQYPWVREVFRYSTVDDVMDLLESNTELLPSDNADTTP